MQNRDLDVTILNFKRQHRITINYRMQSNSYKKSHISLLETAKPTEPSQKKHSQTYTYLERSENHNFNTKKGALGSCPSDVARLNKYL